MPSPITERRKNFRDSPMLVATTVYCESKDGPSENNEMIRPHTVLSFHSNVLSTSCLGLIEDCKLLSSAAL